MEVRIGVTQTPREIEVELADGVQAEVIKDFEKALATDGGVFWLTDRKGRTVGVPAAKIAYLEINATEERRVGFGLA